MLRHRIHITALKVPRCSYTIDRVESIERTDEFQKAMILRQSRRPAVARAITTKKEKTVQWVSSLRELELPQLGKEELTALAVKHYNDRGDPRPYWVFERDSREGRDYSWQAASLNSDSDSLARITVNYIRHELTAYEERLLASKGRVGVQEAKNAIRSKILKAIATAYPWLAEECESQEGKRDFD